MDELEVKIVDLEPMIVASAYAFGKSPEEQALHNLNTWAASRGFLDDLENHPIFGFDNPPPSGPNQKYGYEFWMKVAPNTEPENNIRICYFGGGTYAVTRCLSAFKIHETWIALFEWVTNKSCKLGTHQKLERFISGDSPENIVMDLYFPIYK